MTNASKYLALKKLFFISLLFSIFQLVSCRKSADVPEINDPIRSWLHANGGVFSKESIFIQYKDSSMATGKLAWERKTTYESGGHTYTEIPFEFITNGQKIIVFSSDKHDSDQAVFSLVFRTDGDKIIAAQKTLMKGVVVKKGNRLLAGNIIYFSDLQGNIISDWFNDQVRNKTFKINRRPQGYGMNLSTTCMSWPATTYSTSCYQTPGGGEYDNTCYRVRVTTSYDVCYEDEGAQPKEIWIPEGGGGNYGEDAVFEFASDSAVNILQLLNCFTTVPSQGATYSVKICADLPVNWKYSTLQSGGHPGHAFLTFTKTNGNQSVTKSFGFYPSTGWKSISMGNVSSKIVDDGDHEYNAAYTLDNVSATSFTMGCVAAVLFSGDQYDLNDNNCTDYALSIFNTFLPSNDQFIVPDWIDNYGVNFGTTPNGLYKAIQNLSESNHPNAVKATTGTFRSPAATGICQ